MKESEMKFLELTQLQNENRTQDPGIAIAVEHIITIGVFRYSTGEVVTDITLTNGKKVEVTESFRDVMNMLGAK
jgi:hypothetical protein